MADADGAPLALSQALLVAARTGEPELAPLVRERAMRGNLRACRGFFEDVGRVVGGRPTSLHVMEHGLLRVNCRAPAPACASGRIGCATPDEVDYDSDESYECVCAADYEDDTAYYSEDVVQTVCMDPAYADLVVEDAVEDCASDLEDLGYYNITCSCLCDALGEEC